MKKLTLTVAALSLTAGMAFAQGNPGAHMMEQWDADGDGQVTLDEARTKRGEIFFMFDTEGDGTLSVEDWGLVADHMAAEAGGNGEGQGAGNGHGNGPGAAMHEAMTPEFNDADGDGKVTQDEFTAATDKLFKALDRDEDGVITAKDFGRG